MLAFRSDDVDEVLREAKMIRQFVKAARAKEQKAHRPEPEPEPTDRGWCERHGTWLNLRQKNGGVWYSHKIVEEWCRRAAK